MSILYGVRLYNNDEILYGDYISDKNNLQVTLIKYTFPKWYEFWKTKKNLVYTIKASDISYISIYNLNDEQIEEYIKYCEELTLENPTSQVIPNLDPEDVLDEEGTNIIEYRHTGKTDDHMFG